MIVSEKKKKIGCPEDVYNLIYPILDMEHQVDRDKEHFWVIGLNTKNVSQYVELVALGGLNACPVSPREIFRLAIIRAVAGLVAVHNHPSGDPEPSEEDIRMTKRLVEAGKLLDIPVLDSIIIANPAIGNPILKNPINAENYTIEDPEEKTNFFSARENKLI